MRLLRTFVAFQARSMFSNGRGTEIGWSSLFSVGPCGSMSSSEFVFCFQIKAAHAHAIDPMKAGIAATRKKVLIDTDAATKDAPTIGAAMEPMRPAANAMPAARERMAVL